MEVKEVSNDVYKILYKNEPKDGRKAPLVSSMKVSKKWKISRRMKKSRTFNNKSKQAQLSIN
jgi:hypothetical protein